MLLIFADRRLVPIANEQGALTRAKRLCADRKSMRYISSVWVNEFDLPVLDSKSIARIFDRA